MLKIYTNKVMNGKNKIDIKKNVRFANDKSQI